MQILIGELSTSIASRAKSELQYGHCFSASLHMHTALDNSYARRKGRDR